MVSIDLGEKFEPSQDGVALGLDGHPWRRRFVEIQGQSREQFLVLSRDGRNVLGSGFNEKAAAFFARRRLEFLALPPQAFSEHLAGSVFRDVTDGPGRLVEWQVLSPAGMVLGSSVSGREDACREAEISILSQRDIADLALDDFLKIAFPVPVRSGVGRREAPTLLGDDQSHLLRMLRAVYARSPGARLEGEGRDAFVNRIRVEIAKKCHFEGVDLYSGSVDLPEVGGRFFLVLHREGLSPQAALRTAYQGELESRQEGQPVRQRA